MTKEANRPQASELLQWIPNHVIQSVSRIRTDIVNVRFKNRDYVKNTVSVMKQVIKKKKVSSLNPLCVTNLVIFITIYLL